MRPLGHAPAPSHQLGTLRTSLQLPLSITGTGPPAFPCPCAPLTSRSQGLPFSPKTQGLGNFPSVPPAMALATLSHGTGMSSPPPVQPAQPVWCW